MEPSAGEETTLRVIALIDLPDLQWQIKQMGGAARDGLPDDAAEVIAEVVRRLEAGLQALPPADEAGGVSLDAVFDAIYVYAPRDASRPGGSERVVFKEWAGGAKRDCWGCYKACTHCQDGTRGRPAGRGLSNPIAGDLLELTRNNAFDRAVLVSADVFLIPVVQFVQSRGRKLIHGCFPPIAADLTRECWAFIDLRGLVRPSE